MEDIFYYMDEMIFVSCYLETIRCRMLWRDKWKGSGNGL